MIQIAHTSSLFFLSLAISLNGLAAELPRLADSISPESQTYAKQKELPNLDEAYVSVSPADLGDGIEVGQLELPGAEKAVAEFVAADRQGSFANLDSLLLWHNGKLLFEYYNRRGRVDGPHYAMSVTKTMTSLTLARAIELRLLAMSDLDKPVIDFMPEIDRSTIQSGVETITLRDWITQEQDPSIAISKISSASNTKPSMTRPAWIASWNFPDWKASFPLSKAPTLSPTPLRLQRT